MPVIVMCKDPVEFNRSVCEFWRRRRSELGTSHNFSEFIADEFRVYDNSKKQAPQYLYANPTDYWNQFYFAYQNWPAIANRLQFVRVEQLQTDAEQVCLKVAEASQLVRRQDNERICLPEQAVLPSGDGKKVELGESLPTVSEAPTEQDRAFIWSRVHQEVAGKLGYTKPVGL